MGVEGGNYYEDAILREQNQVERQEERDAIDERLERADVARETQGGVESIQADVERQEEVVAMLTNFEGLAESEGLSKMDEFREFILTADGNIQSEFLDPGNIGNLFNTVKESSRFPVNSFEFHQAIIEGSVLSSHIELEQAEQNDEQVEQNDEQAKKLLGDLHRFKNSVSALNISNIRLHILLNDLPGELNQTNRDFINNAGREIALLLRNNDLIETEILPQAKAAGPEVYDAVVGSIVSLDSSFQARIDAWEMTPDFPELPPEQMVRVSGALGTRVDEVSDDTEQSGNIFTIDGIQGTQVSYDVVTNERSITLDGYTIEANADDEGDYQTPKLAYVRVEQENLPQLQKLISAGQALENAQLENDDVSGIKNVLIEALGYTYFSELGIDGFSDVGQIRDVIKEKFTYHEGELNDAREEYRDELIRLRDAHAGVLAARDKRVRSTLSLLQGTGVTQMPQSVFLQVSEAINLAPAEYGFETEIDLAEGILGFDASGDNENNDRVQFAEMVNVMLGVEPDSPNAINAEAVNGIGNTAIENRNEFDTYVAEHSGWQDIGAANTILQRLKNRDISKNK